MRTREEILAAFDGNTNPTTSTLHIENGLILEALLDLRDFEARRTERQESLEGEGDERFFVPPRHPSEVLAETNTMLTEVRDLLRGLHAIVTAPATSPDAGKCEICKTPIDGGLRCEEHRLT